jgi:ParB family chromosome partitioning protein
MPTLAHIPLMDIDEPELAMRTQMDDAKLQELADSIRDTGLKQPICVKPYTVQVPCVGGANDESGEHTFTESATRFRIWMGHRRFLAHKQLDKHDIMALIYGPDETLDEAAMLAENLCREDVNDGDIAIWLSDLVMAHGWTEEMLMKRLRRSRDWIGDRFRLLRGDPEVLKALCEGHIRFAVARELNKCQSEEYRPYWLKQAIQTGASARQVALWLAGTPVHVAQSDAQPVSAPAAAPDPAPGAPPIECFCCGGDKDRWNLQVVHIHPWCRDNIVKAIAQSEKA